MYTNQAIELKLIKTTKYYQITKSYHKIYLPIVIELEIEEDWVRTSKYIKIGDISIINPDKDSLLGAIRLLVYVREIENKLHQSVRIEFFPQKYFVAKLAKKLQQEGIFKELVTSSYVPGYLAYLDEFLGEIPFVYKLFQCGRKCVELPSYSGNIGQIHSKINELNLWIKDSAIISDEQKVRDAMYYTLQNLVENQILYFE